MPQESLSDLPDNELIPRCIAGEPDAWEVVRRHRRRVFNIAYQFVGRFDEAEDLTQDLFIKVHGSLGRYDTSRTFIFWLTKVTKNLCIDHYRHRRRERELLTGNEDALKVLEAVGGDPYARVRRQEKAAFLRAGLESLSEDLRQAVVLRDIQELTYQEIAEKLAIPVGTVKSRINRGRTELTRILSERERTAHVVRDESPLHEGKSRSLPRRRSG